MSRAGYDGLTVSQTTLRAATAGFGSTATPAMLQRVFGPSWLQTLLQFQTANESCVYYLDSQTPGTRVYQLCFNGSNVLADKSIIDAPGKLGN